MDGDSSVIMIESFVIVIEIVKIILVVFEKVEIVVLVIKIEGVEVIYFEY